MRSWRNSRMCCFRKQTRKETLKTQSLECDPECMMMVIWKSATFTSHKRFHNSKLQSWKTEISAQLPSLIALEYIQLPGLDKYSKMRWSKRTDLFLVHYEKEWTNIIAKTNISKNAFPSGAYILVVPIVEIGPVRAKGHWIIFLGLYYGLITTHHLLTHVQCVICLCSL